MSGVSARSGTDGHAEAPFSAVADAFRANFLGRGELGAALTVYHGVRKVVDLWGGLRDRAAKAPWRQDTLVPVFSTGKGVAAITCAAAVARGLFSYDDRVAAHWPAFARHGKGEMTVADVLTHKSGLVLLGRPLRLSHLYDRAAACALIEEAVPHWQPGRRWGYQIASFGLILGELIRRTDPKGRSFGQFFADEIAEPAELAFWFGLPSTIPRHRVARIEWPQPRRIPELLQAPPALLLRALNPLSLLCRGLWELRHLDVNDPAWIAAEFPSAHGIGEVRAIARLYSLLLEDSAAPGITAATLRRIQAPPEIPADGATDAVMGIAGAWHLGFTRPNSDFAFSPSPRAFGMPGLGGSFAFCDPDAGLAYAYAPNRLGLAPFNDPRERRLREAAYAAIGRA